VVAYIFLIKQKTPIEVGMIVPNDNKKGVAMQIGNKGIANIHLKKIVVNSDGAPKKTNIRVRNGLQEFDLSELFDFEKGKKINIQSMEIKPNTSPKNLKMKLNQGSASAKDKVYDLSVLCNKKITRITIKYRYLGVSFEQVIRLA
jgi:hypothetical protein